MSLFTAVLVRFFVDELVRIIMEHQVEIPEHASPIKVFGVQDRNLRLVREHLGLEIHARGQAIHFEGEEEAVNAAAALFEKIFLDVEAADRLVDELVTPPIPPIGRPSDADGGLSRLGRTRGQRNYVKAIAKHDIVVSTGPAGTGKTYLAVRMAVEALRSGSAKKLILCRPAVEAGESLGFLPGDLHAKVNPYLRPLYDALHSILEFDQIRRYTDREIIEIVPLAYMRGRTLSDAFIILDEGQNTTPSQMKMFLTRMGEGSKIVVTGDPTQADLPPGTLSGLAHARRVLDSVQGICWVELTRADIVRHALVGEIVDAYEEYEGTQGDRRKRRR